MNSYYDFYSLKTSPFNITSDPEFFFESNSHKNALAAVNYGIREKKGIILITGEVGTGKTTLCKTVLNQLDGEVKTSLILNPHFSDVQLLQAITDDFGIDVGKNRLEIIKKLNAFLVQTSLDGGNAVLFIDEAQNLSPRQLEQVRLLSNLETTKEKLLQIVLSGQPELNKKLQSSELRQIKQRIFVKCSLSPLNEEEIKGYIEYRLLKSGNTGIVIPKEGISAINRFSKGIPRLVNMLCDRALLCGFVRNQKIFDQELLNSCIKELQ